MTSTDTLPSTQKGKETEEQEQEEEEEEDNPLVKALPPASDYLTYLTILEYQLTPARLPTLHSLLQDETLTTNIGWDLVQLLLPLLPASQDCLQDVARLGNPREVILRVCDALMKLEPADEEEEEEDDEDEDEDEGEVKAKVKGSTPGEETGQIPLHILQFNSLLSMLVVLHSRIKTKSPSRFVAASLQAALEAYTSFPSDDTTVSFLEFLRSLSSTKRPGLPPRTSSDMHVAVTASTAGEGTSAPDPEAEAQTDSAREEDQPITQRLVQFGLVEAVKTYMLYCTDRQPEGMQWALRLQEKFGQGDTPAEISQMRAFAGHGFLKERDRTIGKILALARDFGLDRQDLLQVVLKPGDGHPLPLDFEELPESADEIPLERHGCLLLLTARYASSALFDYSAQEELNISIYPELCTIVSNFLSPLEPLTDAVTQEPPALLDSLLSFALIALNNKSPSPTTSTEDETQLKQLIIALTACARAPSFCRISRLEQVPWQVFHAIPNAATRFSVLHSIFEDCDNENLRFAHEPAIRWLKDELVSADSSTTTTTTAAEAFATPTAFSTLFPHIYAPLPLLFQNLPSPSSSGTAYLHIFLSFVQTYAPLYLAALNLYLFLLKSPPLRGKLHLSEPSPSPSASESASTTSSSSFNARLRTAYLAPLRRLTGAICSDDAVARAVESEMGGGAEVVAMARNAAHVVMHVMGQIEEAMGDDDKGAVPG